MVREHQGEHNSRHAAIRSIAAKIGCSGGAGHPFPFRERGPLSGSAQAGFVLDALEQALHERRPVGGLVHHSDRGVQYVSMKYTERLAEADVEPSGGRIGGNYDNALAETINGLFKAEVVHRRGPWRSFEAAEYATLKWAEPDSGPRPRRGEGWTAQGDWYNHRRLLEPIGNVPPAEAEAAFYATLEATPTVA